MFLYDSRPGEWEFCASARFIGFLYPFPRLSILPCSQGRIRSCLFAGQICGVEGLSSPSNGAFWPASTRAACRRDEPVVAAPLYSCAVSCLCLIRRGQQFSAANIASVCFRNSRGIVPHRDRKRAAPAPVQAALQNHGPMDRIAGPSFLEFWSFLRQIQAKTSKTPNDSGEELHGAVRAEARTPHIQ